MKEADELLENAGETLEYVKLYAQQKADMIKLDVTERSSKILSGVVTNIISAIVGIIVLLFLSVTLALFLGQLWNNWALGFAIVSLLYIIIGLSIYLMRESLITNPIVSFVITKMYETHDENENDSNQA